MLSHLIQQLISLQINHKSNGLVYFFNGFMAFFDFLPTHVNRTETTDQLQMNLLKGIWQLILSHIHIF